MNLKGLAKQAMADMPETCYCHICKEAKWITTALEGDYTLECGHRYVRINGVWQKD